MKIAPDWYSYDKWAHGWLHFAIVVGVCWILRQPVLGAMLCSFCWGIFYEVVWDSFLVKYWRWLIYKEPVTNGFSDKDVVWNCIGMVLGAIVMLVGGWNWW